MPDTLQIVEGIQKQTSGESISYTIDTDNYPGSGNPTSPSAKVYDVSNNSEVTSTVMPAGSTSVSGTIITLKPLTLLIVGKTYRVQTSFVKSGNTFEPYMDVHCPY